MMTLEDTRYAPSLDTVLSPERCAEFDRLATSLTHWTVASEGVFLEAGERLRTAHGRIAAVRSGIARATEIFTKPVMVEARNGLVATVGTVETVGRLTAERTELTAGLQASIDKARSGSAALKTIFRVLDYIVVIARAQVESMTGAGGDLVSFSRTVDDLVTSGTTVAQAIDMRMDSLRSAIHESRAIASRRAGPAEDWDIANDFVALVDRIEAQQQAAAARRDEAQDAFTAVWKAIGAAVMGLQGHDMARQRLEHTVSHIGLIRTLARDGVFAQGHEPIAPAHRHAAVRRVARLEMAQLADLSTTYGGMMEQLAADLGAIADRLEACCDVLARLRAPGEKGEGLSALEVGVSRLRAVIAAGGEARQMLNESLVRSVERTEHLTEMTDQMTGLEFHLNLAGLNAAIQAAHVEGGDETIGYIARVIREQSSQARDEVETIRNGVDRAASITRELASRILPRSPRARRPSSATSPPPMAACRPPRPTAARALTESAEAADGIGDEIRSVLRMMSLHEEGTRMMLALFGRHRLAGRRLAGGRPAARGGGAVRCVPRRALHDEGGARRAGVGAGLADGSRRRRFAGRRRAGRRRPRRHPVLGPKPASAAGDPPLRRPPAGDACQHRRAEGPARQAPAWMPDRSVPTEQPRATVAPQPRSTPPASPRAAWAGRGRESRASPLASAAARLATTSPATKRPLFDRTASRTSEMHPRKASRPRRVSGTTPSAWPSSRERADSSAVTPSGATRR